MRPPPRVRLISARAATWRAALAVLLLLVGSAALAQDGLRLWHHSARGSPERQALLGLIQDWNTANPDQPATLAAATNTPYAQRVREAAAADALPDLVSLDGPAFAALAFGGKLQPLDTLLPRPLIDGLLPSVVAQGTYPPDRRLYLVGPSESALILWGNRTLLTAAGVRIPLGLDDAWSLAEFEEALAKLKAGGVETPLDLKLNYGAGNWYAYAFTPLLRAFGGDLVDRSRWRAAGTLDGAGSVAALTRLKAWVSAGYVVPATGGDDAFYNRRSAALSLSGPWMQATHARALGADLVVLPMPRFGERSVTGSGAWGYAMSRSSTDPAAAARLLAFLMSDDAIARTVAATAGIPATRSSVSQSPLFQPGGPLAGVVAALEREASPRPAHPAFATFAETFAKAATDILGGADVAVTLAAAAGAIDAHIAANGGFAPFGVP